MRLLVDTRVLLWWLADSQKLSATHRSLIQEEKNTALVSSVAVAEVAIKSSLGKLNAPKMTEEFLIDEGFTLLPLDVRHAAVLRDLPWHHRDPFDRMLVAQCIVEQVPILTVDDRIRAYDVDTA
ncbi:type II toxin-antitoxin system VapC family toxin [Tsukamurella pseudospumae]|uniref:Twitching motility protein PilT n=1 Tax=Tsukamurella pseudospumae TaxID=239498 RepID=A0A137ZYP5_9ACTN|nr:type II toxin-antitoxin system VapC family toxin [Tsukamurella pseudospumae]KXO99565.1 twitching motility protein PilT [Tsukamurella pseudospumae]KXP03321.1 twitching motility protein PilT [Tsukamurella pseudospumae]